MSKVREKIKLTSYDELLKVEITDGLKEIDVDKLHDCNLTEYLTKRTF